VLPQRLASRAANDQVRISNMAVRWRYRYRRQHYMLPRPISTLVIFINWGYLRLPSPF